MLGAKGGKDKDERQSRRNEATDKKITARDLLDCYTNNTFDVAYE